MTTLKAIVLLAAASVVIAAPSLPRALTGGFASTAVTLSPDNQPNLVRCVVSTVYPDRPADAFAHRSVSEPSIRPAIT